MIAWVYLPILSGPWVTPMLFYHRNQPAIRTPLFDNMWKNNELLPISAYSLSKVFHENWLFCHNLFSFQCKSEKLKSLKHSWRINSILWNYGVKWCLKSIAHTWVESHELLDGIAVFPLCYFHETTYVSCLTTSFNN